MGASWNGYRGRQTIQESVTEDENLLRAGVAAVRTSVLSDRSVSLGVAQPDDTLAATRAKALGLRVTRRSSGGTGLLHLPGDIVWSVIVPRDHPLLRAGVVRAYDRLGSPWIPLLDRVGVPVGWRPSPGVSEAFCLLGRRGSALFSGEAVLGGAAQHLTSRAVLHHGVVGLRTDPNQLAELFDLDPAALARVTSLRQLGVRLPPEELAGPLAGLLADLLGLPGPAGDS